MSMLLYILLVSGLVTLAALAAERVLAALRLPARWLWIGAMALTVLVAAGVWTGVISGPSGEYLVIEAHPGTEAPVAAAAVDDSSFGEALAGALSSAVREPAAWLSRGLESAGAAVGAVGLPGWIGGLGAAAWLLLSGALAVGWLRSWRQLDRRRRRWPSARLLAHAVRISDGLGPAVVGIRRPEIVLPDRLLGLPKSRLELILRHEGEHLSAGDTRLLAGALLALIACPWNPFLWIQSRRLRLAVEIDCDTRVLGSGVPARDYARTLIEAGEDRFPGLTPAPALAGPRRQLERRIRTMKPMSRMQRVPVALGGAMLAVAVAVLACEVDTPTAEPIPDASEPAAVDLSASLDLEAQPLVVVDGVITSREQLDEDFGETLSPERIESVEVLRSADAVEEYGERAAGGVIAITTRDAPEIETIEVPPEIEIPAPPESTGPDDMSVEEYTDGRVYDVEVVTPPEPPTEGTFEVSEVERGPDAVGDGEALEGRVRGARILGSDDSSDPGSVSVRLRGRTSVSTQDGSSPLIVVDGIIQASGTIDIPPEQIETVEVIRGGAASELYGSRARDGIIQVRTRTPDGDGAGGR